MAWFAGNGVLSFGTVIIVFLIGAICMFTVPSISTWIISTSGISSATSTFGRSAGTVTSMARKACRKLFLNPFFFLHFDVWPTRLYGPAFFI
jgi:uncharacterized membrane protein AbrB (regulator of aidB expression)